MFHII